MRSVAALVCLLAAACAPHPAVELGVVQRRDLERVVTLHGEIVAAAYQEVGAERMGRIVEIRVAEGDLVRKGQELIRLETLQPATDLAAQNDALDILRAEVHAADGSLEANQATRNAQSDALERYREELKRLTDALRRAEALEKDGLIARNDVEAASAAVPEARARLAEAEADHDALETQRAELLARREAAAERLARIQGRLPRPRDPVAPFSAFAPIAGMVVRIPAELGGTVTPGLDNAAAGLGLTLADVSALFFEALVNPSEIGEARPGDRLEILSPEQPLPAAIESIVESGDGKLKVTARLENPPQSLRPLVRSEGNLVAARRQAALAIPSQALTTRAAGANRDETQGVFVVEDETARFRPVRTGVAAGGFVEIMDGLAEGETIVTSGEVGRLRSGDKVRPADEK